MVPHKIDTYEECRTRMVDLLVREGYASSKPVIDAMKKVPRHLFVPPENVRYAYDDRPLPTREGQTISAPHMVAIMCEKLSLRPGLRVLEIGSGSGYHACVVAEIIGESGHVFSVERIQSLAETARAVIEKCGFSERITIHMGDGSVGLPDKAPFDRIYITASVPEIPRPIIDQLVEGGIALAPVGSLHYQELIRLTNNRGKLSSENFGGCIFVPLIGDFGHTIERD